MAESVKEEVKTSSTASAASAAKAEQKSKYKCVVKCYWNKKLYREGEIITTSAKDVPPHFTKL